MRLTLPQIGLLGALVGAALGFRHLLASPSIASGVGAWIGFVVLCAITAALGYHAFNKQTKWWSRILSGFAFVWLLIGMIWIAAGRIQ